MKTQKVLLVLIFLGLCMVMNSCKKKEEPAPTPTKACPTEATNVSLIAGSIGEWTIGHEGKDGYSSDGTNLVSTCSWTVYNGEGGGVGHTYALQVNSAGSIVQRWANNTFVAYELRAGWTGATEKGLHMGDSVYKFRAQYDTINFHKIPPYTNVYELKVPTGNPSVTMHFASEAGKLEQIVVTLPY